MTYSTSNQKHFNTIKSTLTKGYQAVGNRTYSELEFEINEHPNQEGIMFYLINIIRTRTTKTRW